jgi:hypothetical protein
MFGGQIRANPFPDISEKGNPLNIFPEEATIQ